jgi:hypothetical protein
MCNTLRSEAVCDISCYSNRKSQTHLYTQSVACKGTSNARMSSVLYPLYISQFSKVLLPRLHLRSSRSEPEVFRIPLGTTVLCVKSYSDLALEGEDLDGTKNVAMKTCNWSENRQVAIPQTVTLQLRNKRATQSPQ